MLYELLRHTDKQNFDAEVISLTDAGIYGARIARLGVPVHTLGMRGAAGDARAWQRLIKHLRGSRPDIVQTWLYHADLVGGLAARAACVPRVVWGIHISRLDARGAKPTTLWTVRAGARLSGLVPHKIICCAESAARLHAGMGYQANKMTVIPNGFDLQRFKPDAAARALVRHELGIADRTPLVGMISRFDPQKDHETFVRAAATLRSRLPEAKFLLCGEGSDWHNQKLVGWIEEQNLRDCFHLIGRRDDTPRLYPALDVLTLSSAYGEAFPMVVGEAMACGVPCVVTDVGDSGLLVGDTGRVVPVRDSGALAEAWNVVIGMTREAREALGSAARRRILSHYEIEAVAARYENLYRTLTKSQKQEH